MRILVAPNSMKGSLDAISFAKIMQMALNSVSSSFEISLLPVADGGDGTADILIHAMGLDRYEINVSDPLGRSIVAGYGLNENLAVIEMASASGMKTLRNEELNPMQASSFGTGELIADAIKHGVSEVWLGLGGSATVDGGTGLLEALGFRFFDQSDKLVKGNGAGLSEIRRIEFPEKEFASHVRFKLICDVDNPLLGDDGAARVFAPQKGATPEMVEELEFGLENWRSVLMQHNKNDYSTENGAGAAGGISVALCALLNAEIVSGADFILDKLHFNEYAEWADLIITGEGKLDSQSLNKKAPYVVASRARELGKTVFAIVGSHDDGVMEPFSRVFSLVNSKVDSGLSMRWAAKLIEAKTKEIGRMLIKENRNMNKIQLLIDSNQLDAALEELIQLKSGTTDHEELVQIHRLGAIVYSKQQNWGGVINESNEILEIFPNDKQAKSDIAMARSILGFFNPDQFNP